MIQYQALDDLARIKVNKKGTLLNEILDIYFEQTPKRLASLETALNNMDKTVIHQNAHSLKASCAYLGIMDMVDLCNALEEWGSDPDRKNLNEAKAYLSALEDSFEDSIRELNEYIKKNSN